MSAILTYLASFGLVPHHPPERMYTCRSKEESRKCGLLMEWIWHHVFGEPAVQDEALRPLIPLLPDADRLALRKRPECLRPRTSQPPAATATV